MKKTFDIFTGALVTAALVALAIFINSVRTEHAKNLAVKPDTRIVRGRPVGAIDAVKIYEMTRADSVKLYVVVSNAPGVTASITIAK